MYRPSVSIAGLIMSQTGTYREQGIRPFQTNVTTEAANKLYQATEGGRNLGLGNIQFVAGDIMRPSTEIERNADIVNSWTCRRFRFVMRVVEQNPLSSGSVTQRIFFGYTDHSDASINHLDPNTRFYFNSETVIQSFTRMTPNGPVVDTNVVASNQVVNPTSNNHTTGFYQESGYLMRPEDVFGVSQANHTAGLLTNLSGESFQVYDSRAMVGNGSMRYTRRADNVPARYLTASLNAYRNALKETEMGAEFGGHEVSNDVDLIFSQARAFASNPDVSTNDFFSILKEQSGFLERGYVTLADLNRIFPECDNNTHYSMNDGGGIRQVNTHDQSDHWMGNDNTTVAATMLAQIVPAITMANLIRTVSFAATNGPGWNEYHIDLHPEGCYSLVDNLDMIKYFTEFKRRVAVDVLNTISHGNQIPFQLSMSTDLAGDSVIDISLDGEPVRRYVAPTFCDSLYTPVLTFDRQRMDNLSSDIGHVVTDLCNAQPETGQQVMSGTQTYHDTNSSRGQDDYTSIL